MADTNTYGLTCTVHGLNDAANDAVNRALIDADIPSTEWINSHLVHAVKDTLDDFDFTEILSIVAEDGAIDNHIENILDSVLCDYDFYEVVRDVMRQIDLYEYLDVHEVAEMVDEINAEFTVRNGDYVRDIERLEQRLWQLENPWYIRAGRAVKARILSLIPKWRRNNEH